ncbi:MAG: hypothetical protein ACK5JO_16145 [Halodesulfovibrio sp.]
MSTWKKIICVIMMILMAAAAVAPLAGCTHKAKGEYTVGTEKTG